MAEAEIKDQARAAFIRGQSLEQIAEDLGLDRPTIDAWAALGAWNQRRGAWLADPRGAASSLREVLGHKIEAMLALGDIDKAGADELAKITTALAKIESAGYDLKAATVEVIERLAKFTAGRETDPERREWLSELLDAFFAAVALEA